MKNFFILFLILGTLTACSKDDEHSKMEQIIGEWKLVKMQQYAINEKGEFQLFTTDYPDKNIIYNFQVNGVLMVTGGQNVGYPTSEYDYVFEKDYLGASTEDGSKIWLMKINGSKWTYDFTNGIMKLGKSYVDGPNLFFERKQD